MCEATASRVEHQEALPAFGTATVIGVSNDTILLRIRSRLVTGRRDDALHPDVLEGAALRGERVVVECQDGVAVIVGVLRTQPTPGVDVAERFTIEAGHIDIRGEHTVSLSARTASIALRAIGEAELLAERIYSRATGVHKIIGTILRLN